MLLFYGMCLFTSLSAVACQTLVIVFVTHVCDNNPSLNTLPCVSYAILRHLFGICGCYFVFGLNKY